MKRTKRIRVFGVVAATLILAVVSTPALTGVTTAQATDAHTLIQGTGSSWAANAVSQWVADVHSQGLQVVYSPDGDAAGRQDFANRTSDFAVTSLGYQGKDPVAGVPDTSQGRQYAYLPIAAGGTAFPYQIKVQGQQIRNLRLSGETLAKIFTNQITNWDNPEITKDNNGHALPSLPIVPVVQSEGSGATAQLTKYFANQYPSIWKPYNNGSDAFTEYYPHKGIQNASNGSDGAMNFIASAQANGSIGYVEYSYALAKNYPVAKLLNKAGYYTLPTQFNVAVALEKAQINEHKNSPNYLLQNLNNVYTDPDKRTYPLSSYVYMIEPTGRYPSPESKITPAKRQTIADFEYYSICQGQKEIGPIGYSPLPVNLVEAGFGQLQKLKAADPSIDLSNRNVKTCDNPTFVQGHPSTNYLAKIAPFPAACDKIGAGPCDPSGTVAQTENTPTPTPRSGTGGRHNGSSGAPTPTSGGTSAPGSSPGQTQAQTGAGGGPTANPTTTSGVSDVSGTTGSSGGVTNVATVPTGLAGYRSGHLTKYLAPLAVVLLLLALILPPVIARRMSANRRGGA